VNRGQFINFVAEKLGEADDETKGLISGWVGRWYEFIYNEANWSDVLDIYEMSVTSGDVVIPNVYERVVSLNAGNVVIDPMDRVTAMRKCPQLFGETSTLPQLWYSDIEVALAVLPGGDKLRFNSDNATDTNISVFIRGEYNGAAVRETITLNGSNQITTANMYDYPFVIQKEETEGTVSIRDDSANALLGEMWAEETTRKYTRVKLVPAPSQSIDLKLVVKRRCIPLTTDLDAPVLRGIENCLKAYLEFEMLEYQRQFGDAQLKKQEANNLLQQLKDNDQLLQGNIQQIIPEVEGDESTIEPTSSWPFGGY
jgi:hypothetical protein